MGKSVEVGKAVEVAGTETMVVIDNDVELTMRARTTIMVVRSTVAKATHTNAVVLSTIKASVLYRASISTAMENI